MRRKNILALVVIISLFFGQMSTFADSINLETNDIVVEEVSLEKKELELRNLLEQSGFKKLNSAPTDVEPLVINSEEELEELLAHIDTLRTNLCTDNNETEVKQINLSDSYVSEQLQSTLGIKTSAIDMVHEKFLTSWNGVGTDLYYEVGYTYHPVDDGSGLPGQYYLSKRYSCYDVHLPLPGMKYESTSAYANLSSSKLSISCHAEGKLIWYIWIPWLGEWQWFDDLRYSKSWTIVH